MINNNDNHVYNTLFIYLQKFTISGKTVCYHIAGYSQHVEEYNLLHVRIVNGINADMSIQTTISC